MQQTKAAAATAPISVSRPSWFLAADKLRKNLEPSDYKHVVLGLIFLKYISDSAASRNISWQAYRGRRHAGRVVYNLDQMRGTGNIGQLQVIVGTEQLLDMCTVLPYDTL